VVRVYARLVRSRFGDRVREIVLFGSRARGEAYEDSDHDVLAVIDDLDDAELVEAIDLAYAANRAADDWPGVAPLVYSTARAASMRSGGRRLFRDIDREGIRL
jgi:predicted nucleotidyltransferase